MAWTGYQIILVVMLVSTGTFNTLSTKWADRIISKGADGTTRQFIHPFFQTAVMFAGEITCLLTFKLLYFYFKYKDSSHEDRDILRGNRNFNVWIFCLPAMCDIVATSLMNIGLTMTYAASYQMLRGSLIIFVALLSVGFLQRKIILREWSGIALIISGLVIVGVSDFMFGTNKTVGKNNVLTGDLLIITAQIITAVQIVIEEHFVSGLNIPPLQAVGLEGCFGFTILGILLVPMHYIYIGKPISESPHGRLEDLNDALVQIKNNLLLLIPVFGNGISIAFFNFAGISVTKEISGTTRTVLDSIRTFFVWSITLALKWQDFFALQIFGFFVLLAGIFVYNNILLPTISQKAFNLYETVTQRRRSEPLISQAPDEVSP